MMRTSLKVLPLAILLLAPLGRTDDFSFVQDEELRLELNSRRQDVARTTQRMAQIDEDLAAATDEVTQLTKEAKQIEQQLIHRTSMLYRLSRNGKSLQYLFSAKDALSFFKRIKTLRKLITSQIKSWRHHQMSLARATDRVAQLKKERRNATNMLTQLQQALAAIQHEISLREQP